MQPSLLLGVKKTKPVLTSLSLIFFKLSCEQYFFSWFQQQSYSPSPYLACYLKEYNQLKRIWETQMCIEKPKCGHVPNFAFSYFGVSQSHAFAQIKDSLKILIFPQWRGLCTLEIDVLGLNHSYATY